MICPCHREREAFAAMAEAERATFRRTRRVYEFVVHAFELAWWVLRGRG